MHLNLHQAMLDAHTNTKRSLLLWNLAVTKPSYRELFARHLKEQMKFQAYLAAPPAEFCGKPFRAYDEDARTKRLAASLGANHASR